MIGHIAGSVRVNYKAEPEEIIADIPQLQEAGEFWMTSAFSAFANHVIFTCSLLAHQRLIGELMGGIRPSSSSVVIRRR